MSKKHKPKYGSLKFSVYMILLAAGIYYVGTYTDLLDELTNKYNKYKIEKEENEAESETIENVIENIQPGLSLPVDEILEPSIEEDKQETIEEEEIIEEVEEEIEELPVETYSSELLDMGYEFQQFDFEALKEKSDDVRGWIKIDGTNIDQLVMQGVDNEYYLHHDMDGNETKAGMVFQDIRTVSLEEPSYELSDLTILYGHYLKGQKMFAQLHKYKDSNFVNKYPFGIFYLPDGYAYKINFFGGHVISGDDDSLLYKDSFSTEEEFNEYLNSIYIDSTFESNVDVNYGDKIIALVTCSYETSNSRYVLYGKLEKQYTNYDQIKINEESYSR